MGDVLLAAGIIALLLVYLFYLAISRAVKALYGLLPSVRRRRREGRQRWLKELFREQQERERQEQERLRNEREQLAAIEDAKRKLEESVLDGRFPSEEVLTTLADCDAEIPINAKEALEELLYNRCSLNSMTFDHAVRLIQQRQRINQRADVRAARDRERGFEPTGPVTPAEAYKLLGIGKGCSPDELTAAYHRIVGQWHPDRLNEAMAQELRDYATRRMQRINEAFELLRQRA